RVRWTHRAARTSSPKWSSALASRASASWRWWSARNAGPTKFPLRSSGSPRPPMQAAFRCCRTTTPVPTSGGGFARAGGGRAESRTRVATAEDAASHGDDIVLGAPNVVRGGSHTGWIDATEMIGLGLCSVLASDYYYPAPLLAAFALARRGVLPFGQAWALVS